MRRAARTDPSHGSLLSAIYNLGISWHRCGYPLDFYFLALSSCFLTPFAFHTYSRRSYTVQGAQARCMWRGAFVCIKLHLIISFGVSQLPDQEKLQDSYRMKTYEARTIFLSFIFVVVSPALQATQLLVLRAAYGKYKKWQQSLEGNTFSYCTCTCRYVPKTWDIRFWTLTAMCLTNCTATFKGNEKPGILQGSFS